MLAEASRYCTDGHARGPEEAAKSLEGGAPRQQGSTGTFLALARCRCCLTSHHSNRSERAFPFPNLNKHPTFPKLSPRR